MKTQISTSLNLVAVVLFTCFIFTQARAQGTGCEVSWGTTVSVCTVNFNNISTGGWSTAMYSYSWDFGDGQTFNQFDPVQHTYSVAGTYYVCFTYGITSPTLTCTITDCKSVTVTCTPMGISGYKPSDTGISIYPNPFSSSTTLQSDIFFKDATLTIYNSYGQTVKQIKNISGQAVTLTRDNLPSGLYFIRLTQDNKILATDKLVITDN
jgi:PKD repeat protein